MSSGKVTTGVGPSYSKTAKIKPFIIFVNDIAVPNITPQHFNLKNDLCITLYFLLFYFICINMSDVDRLLKDLIQNLYLLYEFEKPSNYPINFDSGLSLLDTPTKEKRNKISKKNSRNFQLKKQTFSQCQIKFQKGMIQKLMDNTYRFVPENRIFKNYFHCFQYISTKYSMESIINSFSWQEFEKFIVSALNHYGFHAFRTFRYTINKKRHEVDIIARENRKILFIDAKHWSSRTVNMSALKKAAVDQKLRALNLITDKVLCGKLLENLQYLPQSKFRSFQIFPIILVSNKIQHFHIEDGVPILSISHFNHFLNNFSKIEFDLSPIDMKTINLQKKLKF
ncbi:restriction endonuclease [Candidatus Lokiarchaeum ossiferum]|uniref:restriction endonuclease n=1 Tax=Candidatus Lokiarchaeum ossiferum TaxID=2951803 RepID=UPI00352EC72D